MSEWRHLRGLVMGVLLIASASATALISCGGGGGGGGTNGELCDQCGDTDGACHDTVSVSGDSRPAFCGSTDPCTVELRCLRELGSAQRRCYPADPATNALDLEYLCDGARPNPSVVPTTTPTPIPTVTPTPTPTPADTGPTPTGLTPTPTPSPSPTATPGSEAAVDITIDDPDGNVTSSFTVTVTYPPVKGTFLDDGKAACDPDSDLAAVQDNGSGALTISIVGDPSDEFPIGVACTFFQTPGQTLEQPDLGFTSSTGSLEVTIEVTGP